MRIKSHRPYLTADLLLIVATVLAAFGWMFSKEVLTHWAPLLFIGIRFILAAVILGIFGTRQLLALTKENWITALVVGVCFSIAIVFWVYGLHYAEYIGVGAFLTSLGVILVPVVQLFFGERCDRKVWFTLPIAMAGLAALSLESSFEFNLAESAFLTSALLFAIYFSLNSRAALKVPLVALTSVQLLCVGVIVLLLSLVAQEPWDLTPPVETWYWLLASVLIATSLRFFIQTSAQRITTATRAALMMTLEPVWAAIIASYWFDERMSELQILGCTLIFLALVISRIPNWSWMLKIVGRNNR